jgi:hypothetical protein
LLVAGEEKQGIDCAFQVKGWAMENDGEMEWTKMGHRRHELLVLTTWTVSMQLHRSVD